jgi:two-component system heavy metal sensor histidine kinase CusS
MGMTRRLSIRLTAMFVFCAAAVFLIGGVTLHRVLREGMMEQVRQELRLRGSWAESIVARVQDESQWRLWLMPKFNASELGRSDLRLWIVSDTPGFSYGTPRDDITRLAQAGGFGQLFDADHPCALITWSKVIPGDGKRPTVTFVLVKDPLRFEETLDSFRYALLALGGGGVLAVALLGFGIARVGLRPLDKLSRQAQALDPSHQEQRLDLSPMPAELSELTGSFNGALARLEAAYQQLEAFNTDVAHELRTPLTNVIGQTQVVLTRERSATELADVLHSNLEEMERLKGIVNDMLFLARADQGAAATRLVTTSIVGEVGKVVDFLEPLIEERGVRITLHGDELGCIETALLRRALGNLLQNAIEHSTPGDEIAVTITREGQQIEVAVSNPGAEIEGRHLAHLFDRFYRVDSARHNTGGNHGLGLAIVKAIALMHRGSVFARSERGRNTFGFTLAADA